MLYFVTGINQRVWLHYGTDQLRGLEFRKDLSEYVSLRESKGKKLMKKVAVYLRYRFKKFREILFRTWAKAFVLSANPISLLSGQDIKGSYIPPEIYRDELFSIIKTLVATNKFTNLVEIGPSSGGGSTAAILSGCKESSYYQLHLIEIDDFRCALLKRKFKRKSKNIYIHNGSSISFHDFPAWHQVINFYSNHHTNLNKYPLEQVKTWYDHDKLRLRSLSSQKSDKIRKLLAAVYSQKVLDFALIDGCEFTGLAEVKLLYGATFIVLDDINSYKCYEAYHFLVRSGAYRIYAENWNLRNGYAIFEKER